MASSEDLGREIYLSRVVACFAVERLFLDPVEARADESELIAVNQLELPCESYGCSSPHPRSVGHGPRAGRQSSRSIFCRLLGECDDFVVDID
jgi:hypothetical protein